jgi:hypothetical protein
MEVAICGFTVTIDDEDIAIVNSHKWALGTTAFKKHGMVYFNTHICVDGHDSSISLHRLIMGCHVGDGVFVDHKDHNGLNLRKSNLRKCSKAENSRNSVAPKCNTSGYKGVSWHKGNKKWRARIKVDQKDIFLCHSDTEVEAAKIYDMAAIYFFRDFAYTNFPIDTYDKNECKSVVENMLKRKYSSEYKGVSYHKKTKKYQASARINGERMYIGLYATPEQAAIAYDKNIIEFNGCTAKLNFPEGKYSSVL